MGTGTRHKMALMLCAEKVAQCKPGNHLKWYVNQLKKEEEEKKERNAWHSKRGTLGLAVLRYWSIFHAVLR